MQKRGTSAGVNSYRLLSVLHYPTRYFLTMLLHVNAVNLKSCLLLWPAHLPVQSDIKRKLIFICQYNIYIFLFLKSVDPGRVILLPPDLVPGPSWVTEHYRFANMTHGQVRTEFRIGKSGENGLLASITRVLLIFCCLNSAIYDRKQLGVTE